MPSACTNCLGFHYPDHRRASAANQSNNASYAEALATSSGTVPTSRTRSDVLPGSHFQGREPGLKKRILNALKVNPGSAIYVNDICIYLGTERHFDVDDKPSRGRTLEQRVQKERERSMSPARYRQPSPQNHRDRSPPLDCGPPGYYGSSQQQSRYRSRSPLAYCRRTPSPYRLPSYAPDRRARSPRYARDSSAVVFEARNGGDRRDKNREPRRAAPVKFNMPPAQPNFHQTGRPANTSQHVSGNTAEIARGSPLQARDTNSQPMQGVIAESQVKAVSESQSQAEAYKAFKQTQSQMSPPPASSQTRASTIVDDPHFVLGITRGAGRDEILDAYQQRMTEVANERRADENFQHRMPSHIWEDSMNILIAAKSQLLRGV
ncbi:uncharacterized protein RCO7_05451 [Rhynchosporium graminicola]|uniref:Uncharacterized protein n=1 Tax=Rhynchosporium graminicola TaxID=2792576 RepID=A0A1E1KV18_9HELO|nr:uncharacterized protein RCO7_05451 [Rhynchosporium commune]